VYVHVLTKKENIGTSYNINVANKSFKRGAKFRYFGMRLANQIYMHDKTKRRLNERHVCHHSVQNIVS